MIDGNQDYSHEQFGVIEKSPASSAGGAMTTRIACASWSNRTTIGGSDNPSSSIWQITGLLDLLSFSMWILRKPSEYSTFMISTSTLGPDVSLDENRDSTHSFKTNTDTISKKAITVAPTNTIPAIKYTRNPSAPRLSICRSGSSPDSRRTGAPARRVALEDGHSMNGARPISLRHDVSKKRARGQAPFEAGRLGAFSFGAALPSSRCILQAVGGRSVYRRYCRARRISVPLIIGHSVAGSNSMLGWPSWTAQPLSEYVRNRCIPRPIMGVATLAVVSQYCYKLGLSPAMMSPHCHHLFPADGNLDG